MRAIWINPSIARHVLVPLLAFAALAAWPPASGRMLLVPVAGQNVGTVARLALAGGAALLGTGPVPGSLIVVGDRASLARQAVPWRLVILAAPPAGCGDAAIGTAAA